MLGLDNPIHIVFLLVIALLVFGAKRLPELGRSLGEGLRGFRDSVSGDTSLSHVASSEHSLTRVDQVPPGTPLSDDPAPERGGHWSSRDERARVAPAA